MNPEPNNGTGQFAKGTSGNPAGRPPGSRNKTTLAMQALLEGEAEQLTRKAVEMVLAGDLNAMRLCLERLIPPRKDRPIFLDLPAIQNAEDIAAAMTKVVQAVASGEITPTEGQVMANILSAQTGVLGAVDMEGRVKRLEQHLEQMTSDMEHAPAC